MSFFSQIRRRARQSSRRSGRPALGSQSARRLRFELLEARRVLASFFVSNTGNDASDGSAGSPWETIQHASNQVSAGDTVNVLAGNYDGFFVAFKSGTAANPIVFLAQEGVVVDGVPNANNGTDGIRVTQASHIIIDGFEVTGMPRGGIVSSLNHDVTIRNNNSHYNNEWGIFTAFSDDLLIENNITSNSIQQHGIYTSNSADRPVIRGNIVFSNGGNGIHMNADLQSGGDGIISNALVENNIVYDNNVSEGGAALDLDGVQDSVVRNNLFYNNHSGGIVLFTSNPTRHSTGNLIVNNTVIMPSGSRTTLGITDGSINTTVFNNILLNNGVREAINLAPDSQTGFTSDRNVVKNRFSRNKGDSLITLATWQATTGQDQNSIIATSNQVFLDAGANDFRLKSGSLAIDAGVAGLAGATAPGVDIDGTARPLGATWDAGAYEGQPQPNADFDIDGDVDGKDVLSWQRGFGIGTTKAQGDANGDEVVDATDLAAWQLQFGTNSASLSVNATVQDGPAESETTYSAPAVDQSATTEAHDEDFGNIPGFAAILIATEITATRVASRTSSTGERWQTNSMHIAGITGRSSVFESVAPAKGLESDLRPAMLQSLPPRRQLGGQSEPRSQWSLPVDQQALSELVRLDRWYDAVDQALRERLRWQ